MTKSEAVEFLYEKLSYAYCDNCRGIDAEGSCDDCHRKYQNWGLSFGTAIDIIDKILGDE